MPSEPRWWYRPAGAVAYALNPAGMVFGGLAARRMGLEPAYVSRLPVICVGNFTAGGAGKTPVTQMIGERLRALGRSPVVLCRGYGGRVAGPHWVVPGADRSIDVGDEPLLHARVVRTMVARDRVAGAREIERDGGGDVIIMDDGLQNPRLAKTLSIAVVDGARGVGNGRVIPAGPLRAPLDVQLRRVDAVVFNGSPVESVGHMFATHPGLVRMIGSLQPCEADRVALRGRRVVAFAGIGHPQRFFNMLAELGADVLEAVAFPDHHAFTPGDVKRLLDLAQKHSAGLVTTEKDHVRFTRDTTLEALAGLAEPVRVWFEVASQGSDELDRLIAQALAKAV